MPREVRTSWSLLPNSFASKYIRLDYFWSDPAYALLLRSACRKSRYPLYIRIRSEVERCRDNQHQIKQDVSNFKIIQSGSCYSVSRFSSPQTQSWSSTVISVFPRFESVYSTFGGICGYSVRTISLSAYSSLRFVLRVLSEMVFRYRFNSLNRTVSNSIRQ